MAAWNKGKKMPHTPEWEARRLAAVRKAAKQVPSRKGIKRPVSATSPMHLALKKDRAANPEKYKNVAIRNLPKDVNGEKNGNWKGGITAKTRGARFSKEYKHWRLSVIKRDRGKCRLCGAADRLEAHHIIAMSECNLIATLRMNGVTLCRTCHYKNDKAWQGKRAHQIALHGRGMLIFTIPPEFQEYPTVGNWQYTNDGVLVIFVSKMLDPRHEDLVILHELAEALMCRHKGITPGDVDMFDKEWERLHYNNPDDEEPGSDPGAPYYRQHLLAMAIENMVACELGVNFLEYDQDLEAAWTKAGHGSDKAKVLGERADGGCE